MYFSKGLNSMKWLLGGLLHMLMLVALTATADETISTEFSEYLYVWAADAGGTDSDFVSVWDVNPASQSYGQLISTVEVGTIAVAHHTEHFMPEGDLFFVNGFMTGKSFVINVANPLRPVVASAFSSAGPYTYPHSFERTPTGTVLATFHNKGEKDSEAGGLVELDPMGGYIRGSDAADQKDPELRPYSVTPIATIDRVVTTTGDMWGKLEGRSVQIWRMSDLKLLHTVLLPPGPRGDENLDVAEARLLADGKTVIVTTFRCGMYVLSDIDTENPQVTLVKSFPFTSYDAGDQCSVPWRSGKYWVQTNEGTSSLVVLDVSDPYHPKEVDELVLDGPVRPHWISGEVGGNRIALTGRKGWLAGRVVLLQLDPTNGKLTIIEDLRSPGSAYPGLDMTREQWPHGKTGASIPHGAVFSRMDSGPDPR